MRIWIDNEDTRITLREGLQLDIVLPDGKSFNNLTARRLFPISKHNEYVTLLDENGKEVAVIRSLEKLSRESRAAVSQVLQQSYFIPKIEAITDIRDKYGIFHITAKTDHGNCSFKVNARTRSWTVLPDRRVILRDTNDNRYEIPDHEQLDRKSADKYLF
ncbi:MAG: DUF1854 domain-containing protein [Clostridia bacterium]|nr:DUF1854 domain-containing protein [Clostridia bacterium]